MELNRLKKKLITAVRGHKLLKDKRDELMRNFLNLTQKTKILRKIVEQKIASANQNFLKARSAMSREEVNVALMAPKQEVKIKVLHKNIMSAIVPQFEYKTKTSDKNDIYSYGFAFTSADLDFAVGSVSDILPEMIELAEHEKSCKIMSIEIEKTRRRVNALEHVVIPESRQNIRYITMKLDENERSTQARLMKVKEKF
jgi:V/A-type H+-transporting ATPase subunit D